MHVHALRCYGQKLRQASAQQSSDHLRHHAASHAQDDSKKLKYEQMVAIKDAVVTVQQLSAAMLAQQSHQDNSARAHAQLQASGLPCQQKDVFQTTQGL